jgi:3-hydroxybutyryl-CoA dehydratase
VIPLASGDDLPLRRTMVSAEAMRELAEILRDPNPIHLDPGVVAARGLGSRTINQGPANLAYVVDAIEAAAPGAALVELDVRLLANVFDGDTVAAGGCVDVVAGERVECRLWLDVEGGGRVLEGYARLRLPDEKE